MTPAPDPQPTLSFYLRGSDQKEYGPATPQVIAGWIRDERADGETRVRRADAPPEDWVRLAEVPELAAFLPTPGPFPPPHSPSPSIEALPLSAADEAELLTRTCRVSVPDLVGRGARLVQEQPGPLIGAAALILGAFLVLGLVGIIPFAAALTTPVSIVISGPLMGGLWMVFIRASRGRRVEAGEAFAGFGPFFVDLLLVNLLSTVAMMVGMIPGLVPIGIGLGVLIADREADVVYGTLFGIGGFLCAVGGLVAWTLIGYAMALAMDRQTGFWRAMVISFQVVRRRLFRNLLLFLVTSLLGLLGYLLCFVGIFLTFPWIFAVYALAYEEQFGPRPSARQEGT